MLPELNEDSSKHWLSKVIVGTSQYMNKNLEGVITLVSPYHDHKLQAVEQLKDILKLTSDDDLPALFVYHSREDQVRRYSNDLKMYDMTPEMLILWARHEILDIEIPILEEIIEMLKLEIKKGDTEIEQEEIDFYIMNVAEAH